MLLVYAFFILCTGHEFRVVILSVVRTHYTIEKDLTNKCGLYTEKRVLNTAFARVQSLIITAAHPLSLITRGHMSCRLFWASYLSQSLNDEECDQLRKEFVKECQVNQNSEVYNIVSTGQINIPKSEECCNQMFDGLAKQFDAEEAKKVSQSNFTTTSSTSAPDHDNTLSSSYDLSSTNGTTVAPMTNKTLHRTYYINGLHSPYKNIFFPDNYHVVAITRRGESGYALILDPSKKDIWLPDSSALNRSLRGDTIIVEKVTEKKGKVIANLSDHPKKYFVCYSDRHARNLFIPIDKQYPKINSVQNNVEEDGLHIKGINNYFIEYQNIEKNVYLVELKGSWIENNLYPKGDPVKPLSLDGKYIDILKYNYIPAMLSNNGEIMQTFPENWKIPDEE